MAVRKQEAVRREQESRTGCAIAATRWIADLDMSNRWTYSPAGTNYGLRISIQQSVIRSRRWCSGRLLGIWGGDRNV
jgi:hypothetical protein